MSYPKIESVKPLEGKRLRVTFQNGVQKVYDCSTLLVEEPFKPLRQDAFFELVQVDQGGYGLSWNEEIDLSEAELWLYGIPVEPEAAESESLVK